MLTTLSIGGNDLKFSKYVMACLLGLPTTNCAATLAEINNLLNDEDGQHTLMNQLDSVWEGIKGPTDRHGVAKIPNIIHTLYPLLFQANTDRCDNVRISLGRLVRGPLATKALRSQTNGLIELANSRIFTFASAFMLGRGHWEWRGRINILDYNSGWEGHRLCEEFVTDGVGFSNPNVWILGIAQPDSEGVDVTSSDAPPYSQVDINTCNPDSNDYGVAAGCIIARYIAQNPGQDFSDLMLPEWITKSFHPKTAGFTEVRDQIHELLFRRRPSLRVLPLGDSITYGTGSSDGNGYRGEFYSLASKDYTVDMIGSQKAGTMSDNDNEGHSSATISDISGYADAALPKRPNVILLHAGTDDMKNDASAAGASDRLATLIDKILTQCPDASLLVAKLVSSSDGATQSRINSYNAAIESIVSSRADAGKHIQLMHMDAVVTTDYLADGTHPNDSGYARMGYHWHGGVLYADNMGWIQDPVAGEIFLSMIRPGLDE
jgi:lysophospholipase L1-like esterase